MEKEFGETIVLIQVGSFFEVYALKDKDGNIIGSDIETFSNINDMVIAPKANMSFKGCSVLIAGFGLPQLDKYVDKLQEHGDTIVIYKQDMQAKNTTRSLDQIISPGTYFSPETEHISNTTMCVWIEHIHSRQLHRSSSVVIGISTLDILQVKAPCSKVNTLIITTRPPTMNWSDVSTILPNGVYCGDKYGR